MALWWSVHAGPSGGFVLKSQPRFSYDNLPSVSICFGIPPEVSHPLPRAHSLLPYRPSLVDIDRVRGWVNRCVRCHDCQLAGRRGHSVQELFPGLDVLRLIDVRRRCLVELQNFEEYLALSYVWGVVSTFRLTQASLHMLMQENSLDTIMEVLPRTIRDAISFSEKLGQKYLACKSWI